MKKEKKKEKFMKHASKQLMNDLVEAMMRQKSSDSSIHANSMTDNPLDENMRCASEKEAKEISEIQRMYMKIDCIQEEVSAVRKKNKKLEKKLMDMESKWNKHFEKEQKERKGMKESIILMANCTGSAEGDTLPSVLKSLRKSFFKRR